MAVSFPDGRSSLIVSWDQHPHIDYVEDILEDHFQNQAHRLHTKCELRKLSTREVLVTLTKTTTEVLRNIAATTRVPYKNEEITFKIKILAKEIFMESKSWDKITQKIPGVDDTASTISDENEPLVFLEEDQMLDDELETDNLGQQGEHGIKDVRQQEMCIEIPLENYFVKFVEDNRSLLCEIIKLKFDCNAAICTNENLQPASRKESAATFSIPIDKSLSIMTSLPTGVRYLKVLPEGFCICVCLDDLIQHEVDAIVNSTNEYLKPHHGVSHALSKQAGQEYEAECENIVQSHGAVPVGTAVVTGAGKLPCKKVIHAVGPVWNVHPNEESDRLLIYSIRNSLVLANELGMTSIAIPAVSAEHNFPLQRCAELIVNTVKSFYAMWQSTDSLKQVSFVNSNEAITIAMESACNSIFGHTDQKRLLSMAYVPNCIRDIFEIQHLHLEIKRENIEEQNTDAIVNAISRDLNLDTIRLSRAIGRKAGPELQKELRRITKKELMPLGDVLKTSGFLLNCKYVYHAAFSPDSNTESEKFLRMVICKCLELAKEDGINSIAFPATNDTELSLHPKKMAKIFTEEMMNFIEWNLQSQLATVYFVLNPEETEIYEAFLQVFAERKQESEEKENVPVITDSIPFTLDQEERSERFIKLCGKDYPILECAQFWINNTVLSYQEHVNIENNTIMTFSDSEHEILSAFQNKDQITMEETVNDMNACIELSGPHLEILHAALHIEIFLCTLQEKMVHLGETRLLRSLVHWNYSTEDETFQYDDNNNFLLEKAFIDNKKMWFLEVNDTNQTVHLQRFLALDDRRDVFKIERVVQGGEDYLTKLPRSWGPNVSSGYRKIPMDITKNEFKKRVKAFAEAGLTILKIERIQNPVMWACYLRNKAPSQADEDVATLYHVIPSYLCNFICRTGFQEMYSQDHEKQHSEGIYFRNNLKNLMEAVSIVGNIVHIFEAEVFIGNCCKDVSSHISQHLYDYDCFEFTDNVTDAHPAKAFIIYNSSLAYPRYLIVCRTTRNDLIPFPTNVDGTDGHKDFWLPTFHGNVLQSF
ncbi:protein mono-ADP-ribosyltransferase PARP9-like [Rhinoraja longicauda]